MLNELKLLLGVKVLTKDEQKNLKGGVLCCDPNEQCCATGSMCSGVLCSIGTNHCDCSGGCQYCYSFGCGCI